MMHLPPPRKRAPELRLLPMIDVVFFLIVFFMMAAHFARPQPFAIARPAVGATDPGRAGLSVYLVADGRVGLGGGGVVARADLVAALDAARGPCAAGAACDAKPPLWIYADRAAPARDLAGIMADLARAGYGDLHLAAAGGAP